MEQLIDWLALFVAGIIQYVRSQGVEVTPQEIIDRAEKHLEENNAELGEIAKRHLTRFSGGD